MTLPPADSHPPSVLDKLSPENMGGIIGGRGYQDQSVYIALRSIEYMENSAFDALTPEGLDDLDVKWTIDGKTLLELHQVKNFHVTPAIFKEILQRFKARAEALGDAHPVHFVVAARSFSDTIDSLREALVRYREPFHDPLNSVKADTENALRERITKAGMDEFADILMERTTFFDDWFGMRTPSQQIDRLTMALIKTPRYQQVPADILRYAACHLLLHVDHYRNHMWTRQELADVIEQVVERYRRADAIPMRDAIIVHQWSRDLTGVIDPARAQAAGRRLLGDDLIFRQLTLPFQGHAMHQINAMALIQESADPRGPLKRTLEDFPSAEVLLMGVIEIPFGVLTGYLIGEGRRLRYFEYDRDRGEYNWRQPDQAGIERPLKFTQTNVRPEAEEAYIRLSFSSPVTAAQCQPWVPTDAPQLHMSLVVPEKDLILSETQLIAYVKEIRREYELFKNSLPNLRHLHLFMAAPMSLVFNIGRLLKPNDMPPTVTIYHYKNPNYIWGLEIKAGSDRFDPALYRVVEPPVQDA